MTAKEWLTRIRYRLAGYIQVRLTWYFLLILLPLVGLSLFAIFRSQAVLEEQTGQRTQAALHTMADSLDLALQNIVQLSSLVAFHTEINSNLQGVGREPEKRAYVQFAQVMNEITDISAVNLMVDQISIIHMPSRTVISTKGGGIRLPEGAEKQGWYRSLMESDEGMIFYTPQEGDAYLASDSVYLIRTMDPYNRTVMNPNLLLLSLKKSTLIEVARKLLPSGQANLYLYGKGGHLITGTGIGTGTQELNLQREEKTIRRSPDTGEDLVSIRVTSAFTGWSMVLEQPLKELRRETDSIKRFAYGIIALSLILALWISWIVYRGISSPLRKLAYGMKQLRTGNFNIQLADKRVDELGYVIESFNRMAENQRSLIRDHYEKELLLSKVELKFLQSQINPHFLYNTLDSIYWTAKNYEADEISEMVLNLSKFFRLSLSKGRESVSISETIEHLQYYIKVQQLRFLDHFTVRFAVSEESKPYQVLKLLLQPLVENAILHGLEKRSRGGELVIFTMVEGNRLVLGVRDNGIGMNADRLAYIRTELDRASRESSRVPADERKGKDLFGLRNVAARLAVFYGEEAELVFESEEGVGTTSLIYLPLEKCLASDLTRPLPATAG